MLGIGCRFCAYALDEALMVRENAVNRAEAEDIEREAELNEHRRLMGVA